MHLAFTTLDVFTTTRYLGNPLAIVRIPSSSSSESTQAPTESQKQRIATEFNLSETVFLHEPAPGSTAPVVYDIFTSRTRIPFAGHPTIGTALYTKLFAPASFPGLTSLTTPLVGNVPVAYNSAQQTARVVVPHNVRVHRARLAHPLPADIPADSGPAAGTVWAADGKRGGDGCVPIVSIVKGMSFIMVPLAGLDALGRASQAGSGSGSIVPPGDTYKGLHLDADDGWAVGIVNTMYYVEVEGRPVLGAGIEGEWVLRTRVIGRIEDPGTGSASSGLCAYLAMGLEDGLGEGPFRFRLVQGVEMGRQCDIFVRVLRKRKMGVDGEGNGWEVEKVELEGSAVKVMEGVIEV